MRQEPRWRLGLARSFFVASMLPLGWSAPAAAQNAYVTNVVGHPPIGPNISVINTASNTVTATINNPGGPPYGVAVTPDGSKVYVTIQYSPNVSVIDAASNTVIGSPITVGNSPAGVAVTPDGSKVYVANYNFGEGSTVSVIATGSNTVTATVPVGGGPFGVAVTPDGSKVYVTNNHDNTVSVIATATNIVNATIPVGPSPFGVAMTPDGSMVYVVNSNEGNAGSVSMINTTSNTVIGSPITVGNDPAGVAVTPDGSKVYVSETGSNTVSVIATGSNTVIATVPVGNSPNGVAVTPDGSKVYVANGGSSTVSVIATGSNTVTATVPVGGGPQPFGNFIGPVLPARTLTVIETGSGQVTSSPAGINCTASSNECAAPFNLGAPVTLTGAAATGWTFAGWSGGGCSGIDPCTVTLTANTTVTAIFVQDSTTNIALAAAVLPLSRSVAVGATATAFATLIDAGPGNAATCSIAPATSIPASFAFQTTDPTTNALTGTANTPVNIVQGAAQSFVIAFTPSGTFSPTNVLLTFGCANASPAPQIVGIDTLNLSASSSPVPDIVALAASADHGYVDIPGATGTGDFAVATVNLGSAAQITASANTGTANLPVTLTICQTDPTSGSCLAAPAANVTTTIAANATPTFGIFVTGLAAVADLPGLNRVFVQFNDANGVLRGETSVAARTQ